MKKKTKNTLSLLGLVLSVINTLAFIIITIIINQSSKGISNFVTLVTILSVSFIVGWTLLILGNHNN